MPLFRSKNRVASITQPWQDVAMLVELPVNGRGVNRHIRMGFLQGGNAFGAGQQADGLDGLGFELFCLFTAAMAELPVASMGSTTTISRSCISCGILK